MSEILKSTEKQRKYYEKNREKWNEYQREYKKRKYKEDLAYRMKMREYQKERYKMKKLLIE
jgi:hypothetical protein